MKKIALSFLLPGLFAMQSVVAQSTDHLKLSSEYPAAGEKISFTYDPAGTPLDGKSDLQGIVYFLDNKDNPAIDLKLKPDGKLLSGSFKIPANTRFFFVKLNKDTLVDNNNMQGYTYFIYKDKQPVPGAYALKGLIYCNGLARVYAKLKMDQSLGFSLFQKEFELHPESKKDFQPLYINYLLGSKDPATKALAAKQVTELAQIGDEKSMTAAASFLTRLKKPVQADSLKAVIKAKFPDEVAKNDMFTAIIREDSLAKKETLLNEYVAKYPDAPGEKNSQANSMKTQLAYAYLREGKFAGYERVAATIQDKTNLPLYINAGIHEMAKKGDNLDELAKLSKLSIDMVKEKIKKQVPMAYQSPTSVVKVYQTNMNTYMNTYALILSKQGKYQEAYTYEQPVYVESKGNNTDINETYAQILKETGKNKEAMEVIEQAIPKGKSTGEMIGVLKEAYTKVNGSDKGFDAYYSPLRAIYAQKLKGDILKEMINKPAPAFALKDYDGKIVSLADLKGKVVIVDFWATWCGPCKASFPGMQIAVDKYKSDPNVKFVFVDTWETDSNYVALSKKFIADNKYTFNVLLDEKNSDGKQAKVVTDYGVDGIPTKFILDGNGNIRFKKVGWGGNTEVLVDEVSTMIDLAAHPNAAAVAGGQKVSVVVQ